MAASVFVVEGDTSGVATHTDDFADTNDLAGLFYGAMVAAGYSPISVAESMIAFGSETLESFADSSF